MWSHIGQSSQVVYSQSFIVFMRQVYSSSCFNHVLSDKTLRIIQIRLEINGKSLWGYHKRIRKSCKQIRTTLMAVWLRPVLRNSDSTYEIWFKHLTFIDPGTIDFMQLVWDFPFTSICEASEFLWLKARCRQLIRLRPSLKTKLSVLNSF